VTRSSVLGYCAVGVLTGGVFGLVFLVRRHERRASVQPPPAPGDVLVILGARVRKDGSPSAALRARVEHGARLFQQGGVRALVLTGGAMGGGPHSEAAVMRRLLLEAGLPEAVLTLEDQSRDTDENARFARTLLEALAPREVTVVTDGFHAFRAQRLFRAESGFEVTVSPTPLSGVGRSLSALEHFAWTVREAMALCARPGLLLGRRRPSRLRQV
jgi:uncharacterized SAM-binding protein YcdF (DUF218 family)